MCAKKEGSGSERTKYSVANGSQKLPGFVKRFTSLIEETGGLEKTHKLIDISVPTIKYWKNGDRTPSAENLKTLSQKTGKSVDWFLGLVDENNYSNDETIKLISEYTGLSTKTVEVLHFLSSPRNDKEDEKAHKQIIALLNLVLESNYSKTVKYCEDEKELKHILETRYPDIDIDEAENYPPSQADDTSDDPCPLPISNIFSTMYQYINPHDSSLSFFDGKNRTTVTGAAVALDSNGETTAFSVNEIIRTTLFDRIKKQLSALTKEER